MKFKFIAIKKDGKKYTGIKDSYDRNTLYEELKIEGDVLISANEVVKPKFEIDIPFMNSVPEHQKIIFTRNLGSMTKAGLSLAKSLNILAKQITNKRFKKVIEEIESNIREGKSLSQSCSVYPAIFPKVFVSMVRAGEESGKLSESLKIIADQMEGTYKIKQKVKGAMLYPGVILSAMIIIGILMLIYVVPTISATFKGLNVELPLLTRILINSSDFLKNNLLSTLIIAVAIFVSLYLFFISKIGKKFFDFSVLRLPIVGNLVKETNLSRLSRTVSSLLSSGVPYAEAVSITRDVVQNKYYKDILTMAISVVEKGGTLSSVFTENKNLCPDFITEMAVVGEETGKLPEMLMEVAIFYEESVDQKTKDMATIVEPVLLVVIGTAVAFFALAIIKPIYSLVNTI